MQPIPIDLTNGHHPSTGHLMTCQWRREPNAAINGKKPQCAGKNFNGKRCKNLLSLQSCKFKIDVCIYCPTHYNDYCGQKMWDPELSACANKRCDYLDIDISKRTNIHQFNIQDILGLPGKYHHVSESRKKIANWDPDTESYSSSSSENNEDSNDTQSADDEFDENEAESSGSDDHMMENDSCSSEDDNSVMENDSYSSEPGDESDLQDDFSGSDEELQDEFSESEE